MWLLGTKSGIMVCINTYLPDSGCSIVSGHDKQKRSELSFLYFLSAGDTIEPVQPFLEGQRAISNLLVLICSLSFDGASPRYCGSISALLGN